MALDLYYELIVPGLYLLLIAVAAWGFARYVGADPGAIVDTLAAEVKQVRGAKFSSRSLNAFGVLLAFVLVIVLGRLFALPAFGSSQHAPSASPSPLAMDVMAGFTEVTACIALFVLGVWLVTSKVAADKRRLRAPAPALPTMPLAQLKRVLPQAGPSRQAPAPGSGAWSRAAAKYGGPRRKR